MFNVPFYYYYLCMYLYNDGKSPCLISAIVITVACATEQKKYRRPQKKLRTQKKLCSLKSVLSLSKVEWRRQRHGKRWQKGKAKVFLSILVDDSVECYSLFYFIKINLVVRSTFLQKKKKGTQKSPCLDDLYKK